MKKRIPVGQRIVARVIKDFETKLVGWTRGANARDKKGLVTDPLGSDVRSFCAVGYMMRVARSETVHHERVVLRLRQKFADFVATTPDEPNRTLFRINDEARTRRTVVAHLKKFLKFLQAK